MSNPFTSGVHDINYGFTSALTGGMTLAFGVSGQAFIGYQGIGAGDVFVIADTNTADHISSTATNDNGTLYCNFGELSCGAAAVSAVPEPATMTLMALGLAGAMAPIDSFFDRWPLISGLMAGLTHVPVCGASTPSSPWQSLDENV